MLVRLDLLNDDYMAELRRERDRQLSASDWTQASDAPVDREAWAAYRQTLRDLPQTHPNPQALIEFPDPPA